MLCEGFVHFGTGSKKRTAACSRKGYREVMGKKYCFLHSESARAKEAINALRAVGSFASELTEEEVERIRGNNE